VQAAGEHANFPCAELGRHDPSLGAVAVASSPLAALVGLGTERLGELLLEHRLIVSSMRRRSLTWMSWRNRTMSAPVVVTFFTA
jgi:hypothetical protein